MKILIATLILVFSSAAQATQYSCLSEDGSLITYNSNYGEISVMAADGTMVVDGDDGFDQKVLSLEVFPPITSIRVHHHEEVDVPVLNISYLNIHDRPYSGTYYSNDGRALSLKCL